MIIEKLITPASSYPVSISDLKDHLSIEDSEFDNLLTAYRLSAIQFVEKESGRCLMPQTWEVFKQCFNKILILPKGPVTSVTSIKYYDSNNTQQTYDSSNYRLIQGNTKSFIELDWNATIPDLYDRQDAVTIRYVAGSSTVNDLAIHAIKLLVGGWFNNREGELTGTISKELELGVSRLIANFSLGNYV